MKYILFLLLPVLVFAQSQDQNYIISTSYKVETHGAIELPEPEQATVTIQYFDGLGRHIQQVAHRQSNSGKDIVMHSAYDIYGRQDKEYLPYVRATASKDYDGSAQSNLTTFYSTNSQELTGNSFFETTGNPYSQKDIESSPLARVYKQAAPGNGWGLGYGKEVKFDYQTNGIDEVLIFKVTFTPENSDLSPTLTQVGFYKPNLLYKTITKDENWTSGNNNTTEEFKNKKGQVVLKRTYNKGDKHDTYYVYDSYGNLTFVIPPKVDAEQTISEDHLNGLCYQYKYDHRNRLVEKKLPGKQREFILYDKLDRPIATGPAFSPFGSSTEVGWLITKYDVYGRVVYTGWKEEQNMSVEARNTLQNQINNSTLPLFESKTTTSNTIDGIFINYTSNAYPTNGFKLLTVNYYDNYEFPGGPEIFSDGIYAEEILTNVKSLPTGSWTRFLETPADTKGELSYTFYNKNAKPFKTLTFNHLEGFTEVTSLIDFEGKTTESTTRHQRGTDNPLILIVDSFTYSPQSKLISHIQQINDNPKELISFNEYDELGQLISKNVGGQDIETGIGYQKVDFKYNIRGWLKEINDVNSFSSSIGSKVDLFAFKINYNTVTRKNLDTGEIEDVPNSYNDTVKELFNGNIAETYWRSSSDNMLRKYSYAYDDLNRLNDAYYQKPETNIEQRNSYNESLQYDKNGNIERLGRTGNYDGDLNPFRIDVLDYKYDDKSNILLKVTDATNSPLGFKDDSDGSNDNEDDYSYDENGNMISDQNKGIAKIIYNHLNLPIFIEFNAIGQSILYFYNANGVKVKKVVNSGAPYYQLTTTDYLGGFQYKNAELQFFPHPEGYVNKHKDMFSYVYNYTDHLGNIRLSYGMDPKDNVLKILEENHYYPFGLKHTNYSNDIKKFTTETGLHPVTLTPIEEYKIKQIPGEEKLEYKYKYNGKEWQDELGLNMYAMDMRMYDPAIARWTSIDPVTHYSMSPYVAFDNNPVYWADPSGADATSLINDLWSKSGSGFTQWTNDGSGNFEQTAYASDDDINTGKAILVAFPDQNPKIPTNQRAGRWIERNFGDGDEKMNGAGHAGIVIIDGESGLSRYFDFGRYSINGLGSLPEDHGAVRSSKSFSKLSVPNWDFSKSNEANVTNILTALQKSPVFKDYGTIMGSLAEGLNFKAMLKYATDMENKGYHPFGGYSSSTNPNNATYCAKFARGVAEAGGFDWSWYVLTGKANVDDVNRTNKNGVKTLKN